MHKAANPEKAEEEPGTGPAAAGGTNINMSTLTTPTP